MPRTISEDIAYTISNNFYQSTGIGLICFDRQLQIVSSIPSVNIINDFLCLGMDPINEFLTKKFREKPEKTDNFFSFILEGNLICNIVLQKNDFQYLKAYVTQPVLINNQSTSGLDQLLDKYGLSIKERNIWRTAIARVPIIKYERLFPLGTVLYHLVQNAPSNKNVQGVQQVLQILQGTGTKSLDIKKSKKIADNEIADVKEHKFESNYAIYVKVKEFILNGDPVGLDFYMRTISAGSVNTGRTFPSDFIRSLKIEFIKSCAMGCLLAVDSGASLKETFEYSDKYIQLMDQLENINDIYELMRNSVVGYARLVLESKTNTLSKPARQVAEYLAAHFKEKVTLSDLSKFTGLSAFHLSGIIKKETGYSMTENLNRLRISESKNLLLKTNDSVLDIAQQVGFNYQNHFASTFKKIVGISPTEFRNASPFKHNNKFKYEPEITLPDLLRQLYGKLSSLQDYYDFARIVDIETKKSWKIPSNDEAIPKPKLCHDFWAQSEPCSDCISFLACARSSSMFKLIDQGEEVFLVMALPRIVSGKKYAIEIIKRVTGNFIYVDDNFNSNYLDHHRHKEGFKEIPSLDYIKRKLSASISKSKLDKVPITLVLTQISFPAMNHGSRIPIVDSLFGYFRQSFEKHSKIGTDWIGYYGGNIIAMLLYNTNESESQIIIDQIHSSFYKDYKDYLEGNLINYEIAFKSGKKTLTDQITDSETFIRQALIDLSSDHA